MNALRALAALGRLQTTAERWSAAVAAWGSEAAALASYPISRTADFESRLDADLAWLEASATRLIAADADDYPPQLRAIPDAPAVLYVRGASAVLASAQVAIVGSRAATAGGLATARDFATKLGRKGLSITSGLAFGIDAASHKAALAVPTPTIAVLPGGLDSVYPAEHAALAEAIIAGGGALLSELPPGWPPRRNDFPRRNRLISGLSLGVVVVEAVDNGGTMHTAGQAVKQRRPLFAVPGSIHNPQSAGCHSLIRAGARLVRNPDDVLHDLNIIEPKQQLNLLEGRPPAVLELDKGSEILLHACGFDPISFDVLVERTGFLPQRIAALLLLLELDGLVESYPGGRYGRVQQA